MDDARDRGLRDRAVARATRDATEKKHRAAALARKQDAERQRTDALRGFGDDRAEQTERVERERRAARLRAQRLADEDAALPAAEPRVRGAEEPEEGVDGDATPPTPPAPPALADGIAE